MRRGGRLDQRGVQIGFGRDDDRVDIARENVIQFGHELNAEVLAGLLAALRVVIPAADRLRAVLGVIEPLAGNGVNMAVGKAQYGDVLHINSVSFMSALYRSCLGFKMRSVFQRAPSIFRQAFM